MTSPVSPKICCSYLYHRTGVGQIATEVFLSIDQVLTCPELCGLGAIHNIIYYVY